MRFFDSTLDSIPFPLFDLSCEQCLEIAGMCLAFPDRLLRHTRILCCNGRHAQEFALLFDRRFFERAHCGPPVLSNWSYSFITGSDRSKRMSLIGSSMFSARSHASSL